MYIVDLMLAIIVICLPLLYNIVGTPSAAETYATERVFISSF